MRKLSEEELLETPIFKVVKKTFDGTDFKPVGLNCNDWAMAIVYDSYDITDANCLLIRQTRWGAEGKTIEFPCGTVEEGEHPYECVLRELKEETGISLVDSFDFMGKFNPNPAQNNNTMYVYGFYCPNLIMRFANRSNQILDENEDCEVFLGRPLDVLIGTECEPHGLMIAGLSYLLGHTFGKTGKTLEKVANTFQTSVKY